MRDTKLFLQRSAQVVAITPCYKWDGRNGSMVWYEDGSVEEYGCRCSWLVKLLADKFYITMEQAQKRAEVGFGKQGMRKPPLLLHEHLCLVPVKCRLPRQHNSSTIGYLVLQKIRSVMEWVHGGTRILFVNQGGTLDITQKKCSVDQQIKKAHCLVRQHQLQQSCSFEVEARSLVETKLLCLPSEQRQTMKDSAQAALQQMRYFSAQLEQEKL